VATLRASCEEFQFRILVSPDATPASAALDGMLAARDRATLERRSSGFDLDLTPPTDERPFFFNLLRLDRPLHALHIVGTRGVLGGNILATLTLWVILLVSLVLVASTIVIPLRTAIHETTPRLVAGGTLYFGLLGLGFMLIEMGLLQRMSLFLGHPVYSLSVVLFSLILATGAGSAASEWLPLDARARFVGWAALLGLYLASLPWWMPDLMRAFQTAEIPVRAALCLGIIAPAGLLMGFGFPTGLTLAAASDDRPAVWFWGINGAAGVLGSVIAVALSIAFGIRTTLLLGALCYLALIPAGLMIGIRPRRATPRRA
jgi:hypothetical protein